MGSLFNFRQKAENATREKPESSALDMTVRLEDVPLWFRRCSPAFIDIVNNIMAKRYGDSFASLAAEKREGRLVAEDIRVAFLTLQYHALTLEDMQEVRRLVTGHECLEEISDVTSPQAWQDKWMMALLHDHIVMTTIMVRAGFNPSVRDQMELPDMAVRLKMKEDLTEYREALKEHVAEYIPTSYRKDS